MGAFLMQQSCRKAQDDKKKQTVDCLDQVKNERITSRKSSQTSENEK